MSAMTDDTGSFSYDITVSIGEKIRTLRKSRNLTQKELAGERITRNMLSLIESGATLPSLPTLRYLASRLNVPLGFFVPSSETEERFLYKLTYLGAMKNAYRNHDYEECIDFCPNPTEADDEVAFLLASSHIGIAQNLADRFSLSEAFAELDAAEIAGARSVYCTSTLKAALSYYRTLFRSLATDSIPDELCDFSGCGEFLPPETVAYFISLRAIRSGGVNELSLPLTLHQNEHIHALELSVDEQYPEALRRLRILSDTAELPSYMLFRVLSDLESTAEASGNVRLAYSATKRKLAVVEKCRVRNMLD